MGLAHTVVCLSFLIYYVCINKNNCWREFLCNILFKIGVFVKTKLFFCVCVKTD